MKKLLCLLFLLFTQVVSGNSPLEISILTCSPGQEVYSVFGHSSIRVIDRVRHTDLVYNFGMFDFDTPNFAYKFIKGKLEYHLGIQKTEDFIQIYTSENRLVTEQVLNLTEEQKTTVVERLNFLYEPDNRYYLYSFLGRNCSTELRDILGIVGVEFPNNTLRSSYQDLINLYLQEGPWLKLGVSMIQGTALNEKANRYQTMFLPDYLKSEIDSIPNLVRSEQDLNDQPVFESLLLKKVFSPTMLFTALMLLSFFWFPRAIKLLISLAIGLTGILILALWLFSEHPELKNNMNIIWCSPLYLLYIPLWIRRRTSKTLVLTLTASTALALIVWGFGYQQFDLSVFPLIVLLGTLNISEMKRLASNPTDREKSLSI